MKNILKWMVMFVFFFNHLCNFAHAFIPYSKIAGDSFKNLPTAKKGGTLYSRLQANPRVLNPMNTGDVSSSNLYPYIFAKLMDWDRETNEYFPMLAEKLDVSKDRKVMMYTLRKEATWEDGTSVTTDDAEFTYATMMNPKTDCAPVRTYFEGMKFEKVDLYTFKLITDKPNINTLGNIAWMFILIQKKQFVNESDFNKAKGILNPVSSGPYRLKNYSRDQKIELERKKDWWGFKLPQYKNIFNFDSIVFRIIPDTALAYEKYVKGEVDVFELNSEMFGTRVKGSDKEKFASDAHSAQKQGKDLWAAFHKTSAPPPYTFIVWNEKRPVFESKKTRQALAQLIDYDQIIEKVYFNMQVRSVSPFGSLTQNTAPDQKSKAFKFNTAKAITLLKEDGWVDSDSDGVLDKTIDGKKIRFEFKIAYNSENPMRAKIAQMVKEHFKKAGIVVNVQGMEWTAYLKDLDERNYDAAIMSWGKGSVHPDIKQLWATKSYENKGSNMGAYSNPEVDRLCDLAATELDAKKRFKIVQKAGALIYDDQPYAFLVEIPGYLAGYHARIKAPKWFMKYDDAPALWLMEN